MRVLTREDLKVIKLGTSSKWRLTVEMYSFIHLEVGAMKNHFIDL